MVAAIFISIMSFILIYVWNIDAPVNIWTTLASLVYSVGCVIAMNCWFEHKKKVKKLEADNAQLQKDVEQIREQLKQHIS